MKSVSKAPALTNSANHSADTKRLNDRKRLIVLLSILVVLSLIGLRWGVLQYMTFTAQTAIKQRDLAKASVWLNRASTWGDSNGEIAFYRARLARLNGDIDSAQRYLNTAQRRGFNPTELRYEALMGTAYFGNLDPLLNELHQILADDTGEHGEVMSAATIGLERSGQYSEALNLTELWMVADAEDPRLYYHQGRLYEETDQFELAHSAYSRAQQLVPQWTDVLMGLGRTELKLNQPNEAAGWFMQALSRAPTKVSAQLGYAQALLKMEQWAESKAQFEQVLTLDKQNYPAQRGLAEIAIGQGKDAEAIAILEQLLAVTPKSKFINQLLAAAYDRTGQSEKAELAKQVIAEADEQLAKQNDYAQLADQRRKEYQFLLQLGSQLTQYDAHAGTKLLRMAAAANPEATEPIQMLKDAFNQLGDVDEAAWYQDMSARILRIQLEKARTPPPDATPEQAAPNQGPISSPQIPRS